MALKDWKKEKDGKAYIYKQKKEKEKVVGWTQNIRIAESFSIWYVLFFYDGIGNYHTKKTFKTKKEAFKYARAYMKEH